METKCGTQIENAAEIKGTDLEESVLVLTRHHSESIDGFLDLYKDVPSADKRHMLHLPQFFKSKTFERFMNIKPSADSNETYDHRKTYWGSGTCELPNLNVDILVGKGEYVEDMAVIFRSPSFKSERSIYSFITNNLDRNY
ncbi:MAG: hypothetical protein AABX48_00100 [Nanoarchaeota archaeon]